MKLIIQIESGNAECSCREDVCDIVEKLLPKMRLAGTDVQHAIRDRNGNKVGWYSISADDDVEGDEDE